jgi:cephalosporin-C deacetylase-like acetyl esterase
MTPVLPSRAPACVLVAVALSVSSPVASADAPDEPRQQLIQYLNAIGRGQAEARGRMVADLTTEAQVAERQALVREKILRLIGGLGEPAPLNVREVGSIAGEGFRVEKVAFQSLPGFWVTANVYVPEASAARFPAVVLTPGHGPDGKLGMYGFAAGLARSGILALAWDPIGEGERLQAFDPTTGKSRIGGATSEHCHANLQSLLIGDHVSRYFIRDGMAAVDYLTSRGDVAADRIGAFGCSGGGTVTAYLAALDPRIKAAAAAGYVTSFRELLPAVGPQEGEQTIPAFLAEGLDLADWIELAAPRPYAIVSTTDDMFPFEGARETYEEARRIYGLMGAADRLQWLTCPGGHCAIGPVTPDIVRFFMRWLQVEGEPPAALTRLRAEQPDALRCTTTGQIATSLGGETVQTINRKRAASLVPKRAAATRPPQLADARQRIRAAVRTLARVARQPGSAPPAATVSETIERGSYRLETIGLRTDEGIDVSGVLAVPKKAGRKRAMLLLDPTPRDEAAAPGGQLDRLASGGEIVFLFQPRPTLPGKEELKSPLLGHFNLLSLRAMLVGKTLVGMRVDDTLRVIDWLMAREDVAQDALSAYGRGALGVVLLHAAALDDRIGRIVIEDTLVTLRDIVDQQVTRDAAQVVVPGALKEYDLPDLALVATARGVVVLNPVDALGESVGDEAFRAAWASALDSDRALKRSGRISLQRPAKPESPGHGSTSWKGSSGPRR